MSKIKSKNYFKSWTVQLNVKVDCQMLLEKKGVGGSGGVNKILKGFWKDFPFQDGVGFLREEGGGQST
jgi:hypothetical protein